MEILVTGGAGYIGSVLTEELLAEEHHVIVVDNLIRGHREAVAQDAIFIEADLSNRDALNRLFQQYSIDAVMHLAALTSVEESVREPRRYYDNNVTYGINLIHCMLGAEVKKMVFSSSAAVYGQPEQIPIKESMPTNPINPYGGLKLEFERMLNLYSEVQGLSSISLRYFNVAGASKRFGQDHSPATMLIPNVLRVALGESEYLPVFGTDYETSDGTCVRDYTHVVDIASAHILALDRVREKAGCRVYNLGNGEGYSVMEVVETARKVTGVDIPVKVYPRRSGDPAKLVADATLARSELGWAPRYPELESIISSAWEWQKNHPKGYNGD